MSVIVSIRIVILGMVLWSSASTPASADSLLLVQGYLGTAGSWRSSGIAAVLHHRGWRDGGHLSMRRGRVVVRQFAAKSPNRFYTLDLPTEAPIGRQANVLAFYIAHLESQHPSEPIILVGHSAGGVVARLELVRSRRNSLQTLITIASPHLGTRVAELGSTIANSPLGWVTPMMGAGTINRFARALSRSVARAAGKPARLAQPAKTPQSAIRQRYSHQGRTCTARR